MQTRLRNFVGNSSRWFRGNNAIPAHCDWHIGRAFAVSRLAEQESVLSEIVQVATDSQVDCVLVSGDIFESRAPSADAESLVYSVFASLVGRGIAAVIAGGNHDHPKRLGALRQLLDPLRIMIRPEPITPEEGGVIEFHAGDETAQSPCCLSLTSDNSSIRAP